MTSLLRLVQLLTMVAWVGGLLFFAFALAPTAFHVLPVREAGLVVGAVLRVFHPAGLVCGAVFLAVTAVLFRQSAMRIRGRYEMELLLAGAMILLTVYLQNRVLPAMERDQARAGGDVNAVAATDPARMDFDRLHRQSERVEGLVLLFGLGVVFLLSREHALVQAGAVQPGRD